MKEKYLEPEVTLLGFISSQSLANGYDFDEDLMGGTDSNSGEGSAAGVWDDDLGLDI